MADPRTLLQLAGAPAHPAPLEAAVLVIVDAQGEYREGRLPLEGIGAAVERLALLLAAAHKAGMPVIHIAHEGRPGGLFDREGAGGAILPELAPTAGEPVVEKGCRTPLPAPTCRTGWRRSAGRNCCWPASRPICASVRRRARRSISAIA